MSAHLQEGIYYAPGQRPPKFFGVLFLRANRDIKSNQIGNALLALWELFKNLKGGIVRDLPGHQVESGDLSILFGYGSNAFTLPAVHRSLPSDLKNFGRFRSPLPTGGGPILIGSGLNYSDDIRINTCTEDVLVQLTAETQLAVNRGIIETWKLLFDITDPKTGTAPLTMTSFFTGFQRDDNRSWIDFHDGLSNMNSDERYGAIAIKSTNVPEDKWTEEGTYITFLRTGVDLTFWRQKTRQQQEIIVGRDKLSGCPLQSLKNSGDPVPVPGCPFQVTNEVVEQGNEEFREPSDVGDELIKQSHVQRANHHIGPITDPSSLRIFRQGYEFLEPIDSAPGFRAGLNFVSFHDTPQRLLRMLTQDTWLGRTNFGGEVDPTIPNTNSLLSIRAGGIFLVPPVIDNEQFPGSSIFIN